MDSNSHDTLATCNSGQGQVTGTVAESQSGTCWMHIRDRESSLGSIPTSASSIVSARYSGNWPLLPSRQLIARAGLATAHNVIVHFIPRDRHAHESPDSSVSVSFFAGAVMGPTSTPSARSDQEGTDWDGPAQKRPKWADFWLDPLGLLGRGNSLRGSVAGLFPKANRAPSF